MHTFAAPPSPAKRGKYRRPAAAAATAAATATAQFPTLCLRGLDVLFALTSPDGGR